MRIRKITVRYEIRYKEELTAYGDHNAPRRDGRSTRLERISLPDVASDEEAKAKFKEWSKKPRFDYVASEPGLYKIIITDEKIA